MRRKRNPRPKGGIVQAATAALLLAVLPAVMQAQTAGAVAPTPQGTQTAPPKSAPAAKKEKLPSAGARRRAVKLYLAASKLYLDGQFEAALADYEQAAQLDPTNADYRMAGDVARSHAVTALIQAAAKDRFTGNAAGAQAALERAQALDPRNPEVVEHLYQLSEDSVRGPARPLYEQGAGSIGQVEPLLTTPGVRSLHLDDGERPLIEQAFKAFGVDAMLDDSVRNTRVRLDIDNADFATAMRALGLVTDTFYVPLDAHRVLVARDTRENRQQFMRQELETVYLSGLSSDQLTEAGNLARNVFEIQQVATDAGPNTLTLRAPPSNLDAFNLNVHDLLAGHDQVMVDVRVIQVAHTNQRNTGVQPPQSISAFNVYSEEQSILNANQSLVQEIISSGLASPNDPLAILGILLASGEVSSSLFSGGLALFGGGLTQSALSPSGPATFTFNLNSSDSRALDNVELRLGDGEAGSIKEGTRYPIQTSIYTSATPGLNIPGLTGAGTSSALSSLISSLGVSTPTVPMIQYEDLGLTLKITPKVLRNDEVALTVDLKMDALSGASLNGNPILNNQAFSGVVTLKRGETAELASQLTKSESRAISGTPGLSQIPGMNNVTDKNVQANYATLLIVMTPHLIRSTQPAGHTPAMVVEKTSMEP